MHEGNLYGDCESVGIHLFKTTKGETYNNKMIRVELNDNEIH